MHYRPSHNAEWPPASQGADFQCKAIKRILYKSDYGIDRSENASIMDHIRLGAYAADDGLSLIAAKKIQGRRGQEGAECVEVAAFNE